MDIKESEADLIVYWCKNQTEANAPGLWYKVSDKNLADESIAYVQERSNADLIIYITKDKNMAGKP